MCKMREKDCWKVEAAGANKQSMVNQTRDSAMYYLVPFVNTSTPWSDQKHFHQGFLILYHIQVYHVSSKVIIK